MRRALVVCIGNRLVADDAAGPKVYDALVRRGLAHHVELKLLGTGGISLLDELHGEELLVVVDAVRFGAPPGTLHVLDWNHLADSAGGLPVTSHDIGIGEVMSVGNQIFPDRMPEKVVLVGIEGECFDQLGVPLTPEVEAAIPRAVKEVFHQCDNP